MADCPEITASSSGIEIRLPGGTTISAAPLSAAPSALELSRSLMAQLQPALAPLAAVLNVIDAVLAIKRLAESIPKALTLPPRPDLIADAVAEVAQKADVLASAIPQLAVPLLLRDIVAALELTATGIENELDALAVQQARAIHARAAAELLDGEAATQLVAVAGCVDATIASSIRALGASNGSVDAVVRVVGVIAALIGAEPPPALGDLGEDLDGARAAVSAFRAAVQGFAAALP